MLTGDLIETFRDELATLIKRNGAITETQQALLRDAESVMQKWDEEEAAGILSELFDALNEFAPPYAHFGASEGDGASYGFWPSMDSILELPRVEDSDGAKALGEDCIFVNDHGNVTVFGGDGSVIFDLV